MIGSLPQALESIPLSAQQSTTMPGLQEGHARRGSGKRSNALIPTSSPDRSCRDHMQQALDEFPNALFELIRVPPRSYEVVQSMVRRR